MKELLARLFPQPDVPATIRLLAQPKPVEIVIPSQERIEAVGEDGDLQDVYDSERNLLYVACTRARDFLSVTAVEPASEFLDDLRNA